jgi:hypothetical protein
MFALEVPILRGDIHCGTLYIHMYLVFYLFSEISFKYMDEKYFILGFIGRIFFGGLTLIYIKSKLLLKK